jgi:hypothetical protein
MMMHIVVDVSIAVETNQSAIMTASIIIRSDFYHQRRKETAVDLGSYTLDSDSGTYMHVCTTPSCY